MIKTKEHFKQFILLGIILAGAAACAVFFMRGEKAWTPGTPLPKERLAIGVLHIDGTQEPHPGRQPPEPNRQILRGDGGGLAPRAGELGKDLSRLDGDEAEAEKSAG